MVNSSEFVANALVETCDEIFAKTVIVFDANGIDKEINLNRPTHVVINAIWVPPEKISKNSLNNSNKKSIELWNNFLFS